MKMIMMMTMRMKATMMTMIMSLTIEGLAFGGNETITSQNGYAQPVLRIFIKYIIVLHVRTATMPFLWARPARRPSFETPPGARARPRAHDRAKHLLFNWIPVFGCPTMAHGKWGVGVGKWHVWDGVGMGNGESM